MHKPTSNNWEITTTGNICLSIVPGRNKPKQFNGDIPWITITDLEGNFWVVKSKSGLAVTREELTRAKGRTVPKNTVIMTCVGDFGISAIAATELVINQQLHGFVCSEKVLPEYLCWVLRSKQREMLSLASQTTIAYLNSTNCESISIDLPPIAQQKKIAEILGTWDEAIGAIEKLIAAKQKLKRAIATFLMAGIFRFPDYKSSPWTLVPLKEVTIFIKDGTHGTHQRIEKGIPLLSATNIREDGSITFEGDISFISEEEYKKIHSKYEIQADDLLLTVVGTLGRRAVVPKTSPTFALQRSVSIIRFNKSILPDFAYHYSGTLLFQHDLIRRANITAQPGVYLGEIEKIKIPLLATQEQIQITSTINSIDKEIRTLSNLLKRYQKQKRGLMQKLLTGQWRVNTEE
jgi:type I restriction enzyme, S subunit